MSLTPLQELLIRADLAGIYHLPPGGREALEAATQAVGYAWLPVHLGQTSDAEQLLQTLGSELALPEWYGANLDALYDCLTDATGWRQATGYVLLVDGCDALQTEDEDAFAQLLAVFEASIDYWREQGIAFWVMFDLRSNGLAMLPTIA